ncbi:HAD hydrolase-like protein [Nannocystis pusilla]|uniref:HAD hydrolase-like protein n=1 Tax=Nannocystis pusilla TaxID=889268 RepID=UPI003DA4BFDD
MIGDIASDVEAGRRAGCRTALLAAAPPPTLRPAPTLVAADLAEAARRIVGDSPRSDHDEHPAPLA